MSKILNMENVEWWLIHAFYREISNTKDISLHNMYHYDRSIIHIKFERILVRTWDD